MNAEEAAAIYGPSSPSAFKLAGTYHNLDKAWSTGHFVVPAETRSVGIYYSVDWVAEVGYFVVRDRGSSHQRFGGSGTPGSSAFDHFNWGYGLTIAGEEVESGARVRSTVSGEWNGR